MPIRQLPPDVAAQIAAGEVVERPASVVKELLENSLDAGAARIAVSVRQGGVAEISVADDGCGIPAAEVPLAFQRHATSKLLTAADLSTVSTLGFRGEALPSIAAVSRLTITTRPPDAPAGQRCELRYGALTAAAALGCPAGTTIRVQELFGNLPARRGFLRSAAAETARIQEVVTRSALAWPEVRFSLTADGRSIVDTPGSGRLTEAILAIYGADIAARMLPLSHDADNPSAGNPSAGNLSDSNLSVSNLSASDLSINGYASAPEISRHNRSGLTLLVNRRWIYDRSLHYAIDQAYHGLLPERRYPIAVINIALPPQRVDVNSHPAKSEVRFRQQPNLFSAVQRAVRDALIAHAPAQPVSRRMTPAAADFPAAPAAGAALSAPGAGPAAPPPEHLQLPSALPSEIIPLRQTLESLRVVGQIRQTYIVAEGDGGMFLIDQHAAHECIVYDRIRKQWANRERIAQPLLAPAPAELTYAQHDTLQQYAALLTAAGYDLEPFGGSAWLLRAVPPQLAAASSDPVQSFLELLDAVALEQVVMEREDALAATLACHSSVRAGKTLAYAEMTALVSQLRETPQPHRCPHGRPTVIHFTEYQLEREFGRR